MGSKMDLHSDDFLRLVIRKQFLLSLTLTGVFLGVLAIVLAAETIAPHLAADRVLGLSVSWWLLALGIQPGVVILGWWYVRRSADFEDEAVGRLDASTLPRPIGTSRTAGARR